MTCSRLPISIVRELSVAASADPRSVQRVLRGERVRGMADGRIRRALAVRGLLPPQSAPSGAAAGTLVEADAPSAPTTEVPP